MKLNLNLSSLRDAFTPDANKTAVKIAAQENPNTLERTNLSNNNSEAALKNLTAQFVGNTATVQKADQTVALPPLPKLPAPPLPPPPAPAARKGFFGWLERTAEKVGNAVSEGVKRVGDALQTVGTGLVSSAVGIVKNVAEGLGDVVSGAVKMLDIRPLGKIFQGDFKGAFEGYGNNLLGGLKEIGVGLVKATIQTSADALIMGVVSGLSAVQTLIGVEPKARGLKPDEIAELRKVYGDTIDYSQVRIKEGKAGLLSVFSQGGDRPFTLGNTIYMKEDKSLNTLVHEMAHVWQHQNGGTDYLTEALGAQFVGDGYDFEKGLQEGKTWSELNPEQQAEMIQTAHQQGYFNSPNARFIVNGVDYTAQLQDALVQVRSGQGAP